MTSFIFEEIDGKYFVREISTEPFKTDDFSNPFKFLKNELNIARTNRRPYKNDFLTILFENAVVELEIIAENHANDQTTYVLKTYVSRGNE